MSKRVPFLATLALAVMLLAAAASAQTPCFGYSVAYVSGPMNIRESHSLGSQIVRKAAAGQSFSVSSSTRGDSYCWLSIPAGWMAWTSRVSASQPAQTASPAGTTSAQPSDIDNCCFVNRQCQSESEWVSGYWAFQRNECPVGGSTAPMSSAQPASSPSGVNNCCHIGWRCESEDAWLAGYFSHAANLCASGQHLASTRRAHVVIDGSPSFRVWTHAAFDLLQQRAPQWYQFALGGMRGIKQLKPGMGSWMGSDLVFDTAWDSNDYPTQRNIYTHAAIMVHEACHGYQFMQGRPDDFSWEGECYLLENRAQAQFDPDDRFGLVKWIQGYIDQFSADTLNRVRRLSPFLN